MGTKLFDLRTEYGDFGFDVDESVDPADVFAEWLSDAISAQLPEPNAVVLSTVGESGPSSRTVLLKGVDDRGFSFFTNHDSRKGLELAADPRCSLLFGWYAIQRQVRIEGEAIRVPRPEVEDYFASRPRGAQLSAWASRQSETVMSRAELEAAYRATVARFANAAIPPPPYWGGYVVVPHVYEFWQGRANRLHDRVRFERNATGWLQVRLAP